MIITNRPKSILFHRHFDQFSGGHQKVFDYFTHIDVHDHHMASIHFSDQSVWDKSNPWSMTRIKPEKNYEPHKFDVNFLAGMDWDTYLSTQNAINHPVLNLIQHVRHAVPGENVHPFLVEKAIRICVSEEVKLAIDETGLVNGPTITIENGLSIPNIVEDKTLDFFIAGLKNPSLALLINKSLLQLGYRVRCQLEPIPRMEFLRALASANVSVLLPLKTEGFYLPALESMQLANITIVPDCVGNRGFCKSILKDKLTGNCLMPNYDEVSILDACNSALKLNQSEPEMKKIREDCLLTLGRHSLSRERTQFYEILDNIDQYW